MLSDSIKLLKNIQQSWVNTFIPARSSDQAPLQSVLGADLTFSSLSENMSSWIKSLEQISSRPRVAKQKPAHLVHGLHQALTMLSAAVQQHEVGTATLVQRHHLGTAFLLVEYLIRQLALDSAKEATALSSAAEKLLKDDISSVQSAAQISQVLLEKKEIIDTGLALIERGAAHVEKLATETKNAVDAATLSVAEAASHASVGMEATVHATQKQIQTSKDGLVAAIEAMQEECGGATKQFKEGLERAESLLSEAVRVKGSIDGLLTAANVSATSATERFELAQKDLKQAEQFQTQARERLEIALRDVQREGLAAAFTQKVDESKEEINNEQKKFIGALIYIGLVSIASTGFAMWQGGLLTFQGFFIRFAQMLALASPGIWLAWTSARRIGALNRVFADYQYKSAAALAYEGYRKEVDAAGNDDLKLQLLEFAVRTFGDNPTRYYDAVRDEAVHPAENFVNRFQIPFKKRVTTPITVPSSPNGDAANA